MKRSVWIFALVLTLAMANTVAADIWEIHYTYYSDATFTTVVGTEVKLCDGSGGGFQDSNWRIRDRYLCSTGDPDGHCYQEYVNGAWTLISCD